MKKLFHDKCSKLKELYRILVHVAINILQQ